MKLDIKTAQRPKTAKNVSKHHITTADWQQLSPIYCRQMFPGMTLEVNQSQITRTQPLVLPTYGKIKVITRAFFVPYRLSYEYFNDFLAGNKVLMDNTLGYQTPKVPWTTDEVFLTVLSTTISTNEVTVGGVSYTCPALSIEVQSSQTYDMMYNRVINNQNVIKYYKFTRFGRWFKKVLNSLGYRFSPVWTDGSDILNLINVDSPNSPKNIKRNALPMLSFFRLYYDWYYPSQFQRTSVIHWLLDKLKHDSNTAISANQILALLSEFSLIYDDSIFDKAWQTPISVLQGTRVQQGNDLYSNYGAFAAAFSPDGNIFSPVDDNGNFINLSSVNSYSGDNDSLPVSHLVEARRNSVPSDSRNEVFNVITQRLQQRVYNYLINNQLFGSRSVENILGQYGIRTPDYRASRSELIGKFQDELMIQDITALAETSQAPLGEYGGKAFGRSYGTFSYTAQEFGQFIICQSIQPESRFCSGSARETYLLQPTDFYTPQFDSLAMQAVSVGEVVNYDNYVINQDLNKRSINPRALFGFLPIYYYYKHDIDCLSGDFTIPRLNTGLNAWHLFRNYDDPDWWKDNEVYAQSESVIQQTGEEFNRIFNVTSQDVDHFFCDIQFDVKQIDCSVPLSQEYSELAGNTGPEVTTSPNGVVLN